MARWFLALPCTAACIAVALLAAGCSGSGARNSVVPGVTAAPGAVNERGPSLINTSATYYTAVLSNNPVAYYTLGDQNTSIATDSSGHGHSGTYNGLGTSLTQGTAGLIANDTTTSTTDNGNIAGSVTAARSSAFENPNVSIEAWVKLSGNAGAFQTLAQYGNWTQNFRGYALDYDGPHSAFAFKIAISTGSGSATIIEPRSGVGFQPQIGTTYHLVGTYNGSSATLYVNGQTAASVVLSGSINYAPASKNAGLVIFEDAGHGSPAGGSLQEVAFYNTALPAFTVSAHYDDGTGTPPPPTPVPAYTDWNTFGDDLQRTGFNPHETTLSANNVTPTSLKQLWATDLGGAVTDQPVLATNVTINSSLANGVYNVLYIGAENNIFYAIDADTGATLWKNTTLGAPLTGGCQDLPNGQFGITGTATFDRNAGIVYVADANDYVHALNMSTGAEQWNVNVLLDPNTNTIVGAPSQDHIYGALALNNGILYAYTGSFCEVAPWHGRIVAINTSTHTMAAAFFPGRTSSGKSGTAYCGGGIWGMGGASIDTNPNSPTFNDVFVATGNVVTSGGGCPTDTLGETYPYGDAVVQLDSQLNLINFATANVNGNNVSGDSDYGATPMLYGVPNCSSLQLSAKNKNGYLYTYAAGNTGLTAEQQLQVGNTTSEGEFVGVPAFNPVAGLVYVGNPNANGNFAHGLNALQQNTGGCTGLNLLWKASIGSANVTSNDNQAPTTANGVVYFTDGLDNQVWAFNAASGALLWQSGTTIGSPCTSYGGACGVLGAATVDGRVFVGSFNHKLYAFSL